MPVSTEVMINGVKKTIDSTTPLSPTDLSELGATLVQTAPVEDSPYARLKELGSGALGVVDAAGSMAHGMVNSAVGGIAGAARAGTELVGAALGAPGASVEGAMNAGADVVRRVQGTTYQPKSDAGKAIVGTIGDAMHTVNTKLGDTGEAVDVGLGGSGAVGRTLGENAIDIGASVLPGVGLVKAGIKSGALLPAKMAPLNLTQSALKRAQDAGFRLDPVEVDPGWWNTTKAAVGDQKKIQAELTDYNAKIADKLGAQDLGLPPKTELNQAAFDSVRASTNPAYDAVRAHTRLMAPDTIYGNAIKDLDSAFQSMKSATPELYKHMDIEKLRASLTASKTPAHGGMWEAKELLDISQNLRSEASSMLKNPQTAGARDVAFAYKRAADAMEGLLERGLSRAGKPELMADFAAARRLKAKAHTLQDNTNMVTGRVNPDGLKAELNAKVPLDGNLKTIAESASVAPNVIKSTEAATKVVDSPRYWHTVPAIVGATAGHAIMPGAGPFVGAAAGLAMPKIARKLVDRRPTVRADQVPINRQYGMGEAAEAATLGGAANDQRLRNESPGP